MMSFTTFLALTAFLFPLAYSPGPGNMFFALNGGRFGIKGIIPSLLGYHVATFVVTLAIGFGAAISFLASPVVARTLVILSALYLLWIAFLSGKAALKPTQTKGLADRSDAQIGDAPGFWAGVMLLIFNPKAYAIIAAMFAAFATVQSDFLELTAITVIFTLNNLVAFVVWAAMGKLLLGPLESRAAHAVYALAFLAVAIWMILR